MRLTKRRGPRAQAGGLRDQLVEAPDICVLLAPGTTRDLLVHLELDDRAEFFELAGDVPRPRQRDTVLLAVPDLVSLRRVVAAVPRMGTAQRVVVWIGGPAARLPAISPRPEWPPVVSISAARGEESYVLLEFESRARTRHVLLEVARAAADSRTMTATWPVLGTARHRPALWSPDPVTVVADPPQLVGPPDAVPPDVLLLDTSDDVPFPGVDPVLGRRPEVRVEEADLTWEELAGLPAEEGIAALRRRGPLSLGPVDDQMINPVGFDRDPDAGLWETSALPGPGPGAGLTICDEDGRPVARVADGGAVNETDVAALRRAIGVHLDWQGGRSPQAFCRIVAALACAGVPMITGDVPEWARALLSPELVSTMRTRPDLTDRLAREEHSVRQRRAALATHATDPWRRSLADAHGLQSPQRARVSVLLATRRPEMLPFALRQVARQRGVDLELVLATHGFSAAPEVLAAVGGLPVTALDVPRDVAFGEVLNRAAAQATGDHLVKMDDDDWYGPDFVADLLLAQRYSGAQLVGCFPEFTFLEPLWLTARRAAPSEVHGPNVAGGTMLVDRGFFRSCGGFRHTAKYVDAGMIAAVRGSGAGLYCMHGLGYVLRRGTHGHTWDPGLGYFLTDGSCSDQWRGFTPSALMEVAPEDRPRRALDEATAR